MYTILTSIALFCSLIFVSAATLLFLRLAKAPSNHK